ncbi:hypothetical protein PSP6_540006 [Paraburkholderia tropica]|uniref:hypothetical protein n=1 Tax=Paraburkholderia tropica TaxID=92647 RepID=UPI001CAFC3B9|nr:hypothetical protein [Paraburkholderia tropica]CAG9229864.1 hypothetical protein PSP6_540006 [Paraburkholderia tropica]
MMPPNVDGTNGSRAAMARKALEAFLAASQCTEAEGLQALLCGLMHLSDRTGKEFAVAFDAALCAYCRQTDRMAA